MQRFLPHLIFIALAMGLGFMNSALFMPDAWYQGLVKPSFNPPNWVFGPVWTVLYILIGIAGGMVWQHDRQSAAMKLWFVQWVLNGLWTPAFFGLYQPGLALIIITAMAIAIALFIRANWKELPTAAWLFIPYLAWVSFATLINASIVILN